MLEITETCHGRKYRYPMLANARNNRGTIYVVPGLYTSSGLPYVGRHKTCNPRVYRKSKDGRDRRHLVVVAQYETKDESRGRALEQQWIDHLGGLDKLDNRRQEIRSAPSDARTLEIMRRAQAAQRKGVAASMARAAARRRGRPLCASKIEAMRAKDQESRAIKRKNSARQYPLSGADYYALRNKPDLRDYIQSKGLDMVGRSGRTLTREEIQTLRMRYKVEGSPVIACL